MRRAAIGDELSYLETAERLAELTQGIAEFWSSSHGWAPTQVADLLSICRLDWLLSLAYCLPMWADEPLDFEQYHDGRLILAWTNLGALVEGYMKLLLCVWKGTYDQNPRTRKGAPVDPDEMKFEELIQYFDKNVWHEAENRKWVLFARRVQARRNAVHAFRNREIGTFDEFYSDTKEFLALADDINGRLPRP